MSYLAFSLLSIYPLGLIYLGNNITITETIELFSSTGTVKLSLRRF